MGTTKNYYQKLSELPIKRLVEKKGGLDYLSWSNAWDMLKKEYPNAQRNVYEHEHTGLNYFTDGKSAYVKVGVVCNKIEHIDLLWTDVEGAEKRMIEGAKETLSFTDYILLEYGLTDMFPEAMSRQETIDLMESYNSRLNADYSDIDLLFKKND